MKRSLTFLSTMFLLALLVVSALFVAGSAPAHAQTTSAHNSTTTASFAFTGLINQGQGKDKDLTGGLTITIGNNGYFNGNFHEPDGTQVSVSGQVVGSNLTITFYNASGQPIIKGQGTANSSGEFTGPFQVYSGWQQVASGIWSALPVQSPSSVLALAFRGKTKEGPTAGTLYTGAIVLNSSTLMGTFNLPNGAVVPVSAQLEQGNISVVFNLGGGMEIFGIGTPYDKGNLKGFAGPFVGHMQGDKGYWHAYFFGF